MIHYKHNPHAELLKTVIWAEWIKVWQPRTAHNNRLANWNRFSEIFIHSFIQCLPSFSHSSYIHTYIFFLRFKCSSLLNTVSSCSSTQKRNRTYRFKKIFIHSSSIYAHIILLRFKCSSLLKHPKSMSFHIKNELYISPQIKITGMICACPGPRVILSHDARQNNNNNNTY